MFQKSRLYLGDCLDKIKLIKSGSVGFICTDLPFGKTKNDWDKIIPPEKLWPEVWRVLKPNGAVVFFGQDKFSAMMMLSSQWHRYNLIYEKTTSTGHLNAKRQPMRCHEDMMIFSKADISIEDILHEDMMLFYKKQPTYNPQKTTGHVRKVSTANHKRNSKKTTNYGEHGLTTYDSTERYPRSVWKYTTDKQKSSLHPTQKPVKLIEDLVLTFSNESETVLDLTSGSGTLGEACFNMKRNFILIEKSESDFEIGKNRIVNLFKDKNIEYKHLLTE